MFIQLHDANTCQPLLLNKACILSVRKHTDDSCYILTRVPYLARPTGGNQDARMFSPYTITPAESYNEIVAMLYPVQNQKKPEETDILKRPVADLELSVRSLNALTHYNVGIKTIGQLVSKCPREIKAIRNLGALSFKEITEKLKERGLELADDKPLRPTILENMQKGERL